MKNINAIRTLSIDMIEKSNSGHPGICMGAAPMMESLLAGPPATGKTYMSNVIKEKHPSAMYIAQDEVVELLYEVKSEFEASFLTIRLVGDLDVLYDRRRERDLVPSRNKGHIMGSYHGYESYTKETYPLSRKQYKANCIKGKYDNFEFGQLIEVDVTDYAQIDYEKINSEVDKFLK